MGNQIRQEVYNEYRIFRKEQARTKAKQTFGIGSWIKHPELEYYCDEDDFSDGYAQITSMSRDELNTTSLKEISYNEVSRFS